MRRIGFFFISFLAFMLPNTWAAEMPFTDVKSTDTYYSAVSELYSKGIITDDGSHTFRPNDLMARDFYVALAVAVGCKKCETPSINDIIKYQYPPFIDIIKTSPHYYCIAYAKDVGITQGYIPDITGKAYCENGQPFTSPPFCAGNNISRIEAAAVLLRRANLWDDTLNAGYLDRTLSIPDVTNYWYGYAKKGIESGLLSQQSNGNISPDEKITRGEFALMAAKILAYTQCNLSNITNSVEAAIGIKDTNGNYITKTSFKKDEAFTLVPITSTGTWNYTWKVVNPYTGEELSGSGGAFPSANFSEGTWIVTLDVIDPKSGKVVSEPFSVINIGTTNTYNGNILIQNNGTITTENTFVAGSPITLLPSDIQSSYVYSWTIVNDKTGETKSGSGTSYDASGLGVGDWTVTLTAKDKNSGTIVWTDVRHIHIGNTTPLPSSPLPPSVLIKVNPISTYLENPISFTGVITSANSNNPLQYAWDFGDGSTSQGVSATQHAYSASGVYTVTLTVTDTVTGLTSQAAVIVRITGEKDTDGDKILDSVDLCPLVVGPKENKGCPIVNTWDATSDSGMTSIASNLCLKGKQGSQGLMIGGAVCNICPCNNSVTIISSLRSCDVVFPTILSPDMTKVYSRGGFYIVP